MEETLSLKFPSINNTKQHTTRVSYFAGLNHHVLGEILFRYSVNFSVVKSLMCNIVINSERFHTILIHLCIL